MCCAVDRLPRAPLATGQHALPLEDDRNAGADVRVLYSHTEVLAATGLSHSSSTFCVIRRILFAMFACYSRL